ncbi:MAG: threonylcarbamoyl-AMP synthase [Candidatus Levybacteria bacterium]|nr:threonylcarbamoyl-AMP synthase [Candidatus Levybacteria bacterium]
MEQIDKAAEVLKNGGVVIFPTDTAFGIGCRIDDEKAVRRVFELKKRDYNKPLLALVNSIEMAREYVSIPKDVEEKLLDRYWPGGLTVFLKCNLEKVPSIVRSGTDSLALRLPDHTDISTVIGRVGVPILATSANISGGSTPYTIFDVNRELISKVDFVLNGECTFRKQSTIIDCTLNPWKIIRQGAVKVSI